MFRLWPHNAEPSVWVSPASGWQLLWPWHVTRVRAGEQHRSDPGICAEGGRKEPRVPKGTWCRSLMTACLCPPASLGSWGSFLLSLDTLSPLKTGSGANWPLSTTLWILLSSDALHWPESVTEAYSLGLKGPGDGDGDGKGGAVLRIIKLKRTSHTPQALIPAPQHPPISMCPSALTWNMQSLRSPPSPGCRLPSWSPSVSETLTSTDCS